MIKRILFIVIMYIMAIFVQPIVQSFDFERGFTPGNMNDWTEQYVMPNYDMSKIEQVNNTQTQDIQYSLGNDFDEEDAGDITLDSEYHGEFHVYNDSGAFHMVLENEGEVTGVYTNSDDVSVNQMNIQDMDREEVNNVYGEPVETVSKGVKQLVVENEEYDVYNINDYYVYFFYDIHNEDEVIGMLVVDEDELSVSGSIYNNPENGEFEEMNYHLVNASRDEFNIEPLEYDDAVSEVARDHSRDMAERDYFAHDSPEGNTLQDRIDGRSLDYELAGENIATGHTSPIFAHHSLMNSMEHRVNILNSSFTHMGAGAGYNDDEEPYYTENYVER